MMDSENLNLIDNVFSKPLTRVFSAKMNPGACEVYENTGLSLGGIALSLRHGNVFVIEEGKQLPDEAVSVVFSEDEISPSKATVRVQEFRSQDGSPSFRITNLSQEEKAFQFFLVLNPQSVRSEDVRILNAKIESLQNAYEDLKGSMEKALLAMGKKADSAWVAENFSPHIELKIHKGGEGAYAVGKKEKLKSMSFVPLFADSSNRFFLLSFNNADGTPLEPGLIHLTGQQGVPGGSTVTPWPV